MHTVQHLDTVNRCTTQMRYYKLYVTYTAKIQCYQNVQGSINLEDMMNLFVKFAYPEKIKLIVYIPFSTKGAALALARKNTIRQMLHIISSALFMYIYL